MAHPMGAERACGAAQWQAVLPGCSPAKGVLDGACTAWAQSWRHGQAVVPDCTTNWTSDRLSQPLSGSTCHDSDNLPPQRAHTLQAPISPLHAFTIMVPRHLAALAALLLPIACHAAYSSSSDVVELDPSSFNSKLKDGLSLVVFYAPVGPRGSLGGSVRRGEGADRLGTHQCTRALPTPPPVPHAVVRPLQGPDPRVVSALERPVVLLALLGTTSFLGALDPPCWCARLFSQPFRSPRANHHSPLSSSAQGKGGNCAQGHRASGCAGR